MMILTAFLLGCADEVRAPSVEARAEDAPVGLPALAADIAAAEAFDDDAPHRGVVQLRDGALLFLYGAPDDVEDIVRGRVPTGVVRGVAVSTRVDDEPIIGLASIVSASPEDASFEPVDGDPIEWSDVRALAADVDAAPLGPEPAFATSCSAPCGHDDGYSFAGVEAKSNGIYTGTGSSCAATGTYGYNYQCVTFVDEVARRADWTGNAYTGYWSSTTAGPYVKGLLPMGSGTAYDAPLAGDTVVWSGGSYGHVGVIASVGTTQLVVYDQNRSCGNQRCELGYSVGSGYAISNGSCFSSTGFTPVGWLRRGWDFCGAFGLASTTSSSNWWPNDAKYVSGTTSGSTSDITDYVVLNPGGTDPYLTSPSGLAIPAYSTSTTWGYKKLVIRMQSNCTSKNIEVFFRRTTDSAFSSSRSAKAKFSGTGFVTVKVPLSRNASWNGTIDQIRIDPAVSCSASSSTDTISLAYAYFDR